VSTTQTVFFVQQTVQIFTMTCVDKTHIRCTLARISVYDTT